MVNENTTVQELFRKGYIITMDGGIAVKQTLFERSCPECGAYLQGHMDILCCTECNYEK